MKTGHANIFPAIRRWEILTACSASVRCMQRKTVREIPRIWKAAEKGSKTVPAVRFPTNRGIMIWWSGFCGKMLPVRPDFQKAEQVVIDGIVIFQINHQPALAIPFFGLPVKLLYFFGAFRQNCFDRFFFFPSHYEQYGEIGLPGIYGAKVFS